MNLLKKLKKLKERLKADGSIIFNIVPDYCELAAVDRPQEAAEHYQEFQERRRRVQNYAQRIFSV